MNFITSRQAMWLEAIERRISATSTMLASMKGIKMCGLKQTLFDNLQKLRIEELQISKKFRKLLIWNMSFGKYSACLDRDVNGLLLIPHSLCHANLCANPHIRGLLDHC